LDLNKELVFEGGDKKTLHGFTAWKPDARTVAAHSADFEKNLEDFTQDLYLAAKKKLPSGPINLVAAIYVPEKGVWFSTKPRGDAAKLILGDLDSAPALKSRVNNGRKVERDVHAEDGTIYWFEKSQNHHMSPDEANNWRFPEGTRLAVYGKVSDYRPEGPVGPCNTDIKYRDTTAFKRDPTCEAVINMLGITPITHW
jgi:hypothetical protein